MSRKFRTDPGFALLAVQAPGASIARSEVGTELIARCCGSSYGATVGAVIAYLSARRAEES